MLVGQAAHDHGSNAPAKSWGAVKVEGNSNKGHHTQLAAIGSKVTAEVAAILGETGKGRNRNRPTPFSLTTDLRPEGTKLKRQQEEIAATSIESDGDGSKTSGRQPASHPEDDQRNRAHGRQRPIWAAKRKKASNMRRLSAEPAGHELQNHQRTRIAFKASYDSKGGKAGRRASTQSMAASMSHHPKASARKASGATAGQPMPGPKHDAANNAP